MTFNDPKSSHISPILRSLYWLKISECIQYKLLFPQPLSLLSSICVKPSPALSPPLLACHNREPVISLKLLIIR